MTRAEAIEILTASDYFWLRPSENEAEALNMAIEALEAEPSEDCISRKWVLNNIRSYAERTTSIEKSSGAKNCAEFVENAPSVVPKRGKWIDRASKLDAGLGRHNFVCSECAHTAWYFVGGSEDWWDREKPNYCPNCGAKMKRTEVED